MLELQNRKFCFPLCSYCQRFVTFLNFSQSNGFRNPLTLSLQKKVEQKIFFWEFFSVESHLPQPQRRRKQIYVLFHWPWALFITSYWLFQGTSASRLKAFKEKFNGFVAAFLIITKVRCMRKFRSSVDVMTILPACRCQAKNRAKSAILPPFSLKC